MSKPYDVGTKFLIETHLPDWLALPRRQTTSPAVIIDADLATVTAAADKVLRIEEAEPWLFHLGVAIFPRKGPSAASSLV